MTYKQINYMYIQKESVRCILIKIKFFSNFIGFHNEHGYISYFNFIFCFYKFNKFGHIQSFPIILDVIVPNVHTHCSKLFDYRLFCLGFRDYEAKILINGVHFSIFEKNKILMTK